MTFDRTGRWGILLTIAAGIVYAWMYLNEPLAQRAGSDGFYSYVYARSVVFDHDIDFANDYRICGDPAERSRDRGGGHVENGFYAGPALYWIPVLWTLEHTVQLPANASPRVINACEGPLAKWTLFVGPMLGMLTIFLSYRISRRITGDGPAALAAALIGFGSPLTGYATMWPHYSHVYDAFSVALLFVLSLRAWERPSALFRWALCGAMVGVSYLHRPPSAIFGLVPLTLACIALWKKWPRLTIALALLGAGTFVFGIIPQSLINEYIFGRYWLWAHPTGNYYLQPGHSHPWLSLFAPQGGLFYTSPVAWLAVAGLPFALRTKTTLRPLVMSAFLATVAIIYLSASALDWNSSASFGARRLTSLVPFLTLLAAFALARAHRWMKARRSRSMVALGVAVLVPVMFLVCGAALGNPEGTTTIERGQTQQQLYGNGAGTIWKLLDEKVGDLAILPAEVVYSWRFGLKMNSFRDVTEPWIARDYRSMVETRNLPAPSDARWLNHVTHMTQTKDGLRMTARRSTAVFASLWPYATELRLRARAASKATLAVGRGGWLAVTPYGSVELPGDGSEVELLIAIPKAAYDSGLNELVYTCDEAPDANVEILLQAPYDTNAYPNPI